jgi:magnesium-transporting ATPase (P-type)
LLAEMPELTVAIALVVVVNALFSFFETYRAERAVAALRQMLPQRVRVRRDGVAADIASEDVVPGDVLLLAPGDRVAADADLLTATELRVDESALTGESTPVEPERQVFAGTYVTGGTAEAVVTATGMQTRFGRIAALSQRTESERSPLEHEIDRVVYIVAALAVTIGSLFFLITGLTDSMDVQDRFVFAIGVTVALVPNGLMPTVTLSLAMASQRMAKRNALVRRLSAVETLGETTIVCTDKTGTLTENQMTVQRVWTPEREYTVEGAGYEPFGRFRAAGEVVDPAPLTELLRAGLLCNDARLQSAEGWSVVGDPTEGALIVLAEKGGLHNRAEAARAPRLREIPFSSERKRMTTVHLVGDERVAYVKGAAELILPRTTLSVQARAEAAAAEAAMEHDALRVLACARRGAARRRR